MEHEADLVQAVRGAARRLRSVDGRRQGQPETPDVDWRFPRDGPQRRDPGPQFRSGPAHVLVRSCGQPGSNAPNRPATSRSGASTARASASPGCSRMSTQPIPARSGSPATIWRAVSRRSCRPSAHRGEVRSEYWSAGFIGAMAIVRLNGRRLVVVGSAANETGGAALAVFDGAAAGLVAGRRPRRIGALAALPGTRLHYLVFPRSRLQAELGGNAFVVRDPRRAGRDDRGSESCRPASSMLARSAGSAYYTFDTAFRLVDAELNPMSRCSSASTRPSTWCRRRRGPGETPTSTLCSAGTGRATTASTGLEVR